MEKTKKIIISLGISLIVLIVLNYIIISNTNGDYIEIPVFKEDMLKGKQVSVSNVINIQVKNTKENKELLQMVISTNFDGKILRNDVSKGEVVTLDKFVSQQDVLESDTSYKYISIPINNLSYPTCSKLKRGDMVTIYYTAKNKDVSNVIKNKQRLYSSTSEDGYVTCLLFEEVEVISLHDSTGKETQENVITDILIRLKNEEAILVSNLKSQGTFDIVLN